ncbi:MAG TPA: hypothetical protein VIM06_07900 [Rhodanobacter sp.]
MADQKSFPTGPNTTVDWNDPHLESLLNKTDGWQLDNRGSIPPLGIQIQFGWGAGVSKPALLVWENEEAMVLETDFPIERGELVRVDKPEESGRPSQWGEVIESRPGRRSDDKANGIQVHWLRLR